MRLRDYGFFFYTGRQVLELILPDQEKIINFFFQGKKPESATSFFAIHTNGIFFFEISSNVFKPPKEIEKYNWRDIKEIQVGASKIQFNLQADFGGSNSSSSVNNNRVKIYLDESKARHVFDMAETYHAHHISCCMSNSPSDANYETLPKIAKTDALNDVFRTFCKKVKR